EELGLQPLRELPLGSTGLFQEFGELGWRGPLAVGGSQQRLQSVGRRGFAEHRGKTHDAVAIREAIEAVVVRLIRPVIADESRDGDLKSTDRINRVAIE